MKLILSNWSGFEIDSSEFAILFDVRDTYSALRGFLTSKMVDNKFSKNNILSAFFTAYQIAKKENKEIFERLTASTVNYHDLEYEDKHAKLIEIHDKYIQRCIDFFYFHN